MVFRIALLGMLLGAPRIFRYMPASNRSMSFLFHNPAAAKGVPMYISIDLARQQVKRSSTSLSTLLSLHLSSWTFLLTCSFEILIWSFLSTATLTPRYFTEVVHLIPLTSSTYSEESISDFFLFSLRFQFTCREVSSLMICSISWILLDITSMSSAKARRSPLERTSFNFCDDLIASSRYTLNSTGEITDP